MKKVKTAVYFPPDSKKTIYKSKYVYIILS